LSQIGLSAQAKYWLEVPNTESRLKLTVQAGIGFVHADFLLGDTSWLIPLGIGMDYALTDKIKLTRS
jgi:hypothetical protein